MYFENLFSRHIMIIAISGIKNIVDIENAFFVCVSVCVYVREEEVIPISYCLKTYTVGIWIANILIAKFAELQTFTCLVFSKFWRVTPVRFATQKNLLIGYYPAPNTWPKQGL